MNVTPQQNRQHFSRWQSSETAELHSPFPDRRKRGIFPGRFRLGKTRLSGFTLIELLAAVSMISALAVFSMAAVAKGRSLVRSSVCQSNLRQIGGAFAAYSADNQALPPGKVWDQRLTPYLGQENASAPMKIFCCPEDQSRRRRPDARSYTASAQKDESPGVGVFSQDSETMSLQLNRIEKPSRTVLVSEYFHKDNLQYQTPYSWTSGWMEETAVPKLPGGAYYHGTRMNILFADGHVEACKGPDIYKVPGQMAGLWRAFQPDPELNLERERPAGRWLAEGKTAPTGNRTQI